MTELDLLVLGSGVAGLSAAVQAAAAEPGMRVGVLSKADRSQATTRWAQGGVAAVLGGDPGQVQLNGAAARLVEPGHRVIVITYADYDDAELTGFAPLLVKVDAENRPQ